ncbi:MAG: hypothetical protein AB7V58_05450 [Solirubrobacterales bacterium]
MVSKRAKFTTTATIAGLGALAGFAVSSNHGLPAATVATVNGHEIVTRTSGGGATATGNSAAPGGRAPLVTRSSGAPGAAPAGDVDD